MANDIRLTTFDNPYDPFEQFSLWYLYDTENNYNTLGKMDRLIRITDDMSDKEIDEERERVMDRLIELDFLNIYRKITKEEAKTASSTAKTA